MRNNQKEIHVLRGYAGNVTTPVVTMYGSAGGHTQTWEYSGRSGKWFVGTKFYATGNVDQIEVGNDAYVKASDVKFVNIVLTLTPSNTAAEAEATALKK
ncbi:MAG: class III bacteriocin [Lactobacillus crispatus]|nr:class III bacteriocin [Lactobacillus crispatus]MCI1336317.1 class III bacteriocin [Lactobacillus crispatus]MCI1365853.1 class III bacteriocin [Lactobacillus crispatus]MCI1494206.1 class III bacteriocin [Lactobacillus crispatus]MCI1524260.1 class III bacteriocin [Lactobacillus crispatus]